MIAKLGQMARALLLMLTGFSDSTSSNSLCNDVNKQTNSKDGFTTINTQQVAYDEAKLSETWDYNKLMYTDFNCRLTASTLYKNFIKYDEKNIYDDFNLMFDLDAIEKNPVSEFAEEEVSKFKALYASIPVENTKDVDKLEERIVKEWGKKKNMLQLYHIKYLNLIIYQS